MYVGSTGRRTVPAARADTEPDQACIANGPSGLVPIPVPKLVVSAPGSPSTNRARRCASRRLAGAPGCRAVPALPRWLPSRDGRRARQLSLRRSRPASAGNPRRRRPAETCSSSADRPARKHARSRVRVRACRGAGEWAIPATAAHIYRHPRRQDLAQMGRASDGSLAVQQLLGSHQKV